MPDPGSTQAAGSTQADVIVLGLGVGGELVATKLAEGGCSVIGIEAELVGGECPYWGCVPTKMMVRAANLLAEARRVDGRAGSATVSPDWLEPLPDSLAVLGGGAIGLELAQVMARFGTQVTIVEAVDRIAFREEPEVSHLLTEVLLEEGIERVTRGNRDGPVAGVVLHLADGSRVSADALLVATGRGNARHPARHVHRSRGGIRRLDRSRGAGITTSP